MRPVSSIEESDETGGQRSPSACAKVHSARAAMSISARLPVAHARIRRYADTDPLKLSHSQIGGWLVTQMDRHLSTSPKRVDGRTRCAIRPPERDATGRTVDVFPASARCRGGGADLESVLTCLPRGEINLKCARWSVRCDLLTTLSVTGRSLPPVGTGWRKGKTAHLHVGRVHDFDRPVCAVSRGDALSEVITPTEVEQKSAVGCLGRGRFSRYPIRRQFPVAQ
jgi:hypothetical protein